MVERAPFLNAALQRLPPSRAPPEEDTEMTRVGPDTPGGEYLRRFWQPVILASELGDLPRRIRILGEDLVVFRDKSGPSALLELLLPTSRDSSLEYRLDRRQRASAAAITAGSSTWTARSWIRRASRPTAR